MTPGIADHLLAVALLALGLFSAARERSPGPDSVSWSSRAKADEYLAASASLWIVTAIVLTVWIASGRGLSELGLRGGRLTPLASGALGVFVAGLIIDTVVQMSPRRRARTRLRWLERTPFMPANGRELGFYAILALTAGLCEELVFRGFLVSYFAALVGSTWPIAALAIAIPAVVFAIGRVAQGVRGVVEAAGWAVVGGIVLIETGSLLPAIAAHAGSDLVIGAVGSRLLREEGM